MTSVLTLGAEEELHLIDLQSWKLVPRAPQLLARLPEDNYSAEIQRSTVETNTDVVDSLAGLRAELLRLRQQIVEVAAPDRIGIAAVGTAPSSAFADFELTTTGRYGRMQEQYRLLVDEQLICGLQIHVGVPDRDLAVEIMQRSNSTSLRACREDTGQEGRRAPVGCGFGAVGDVAHRGTTADALGTQLSTTRGPGSPSRP